MNLVKNMLAAVGVMAVLVLVINTATAEAGKIIKAFDRAQAGQAAIITNHKAYLASDDDSYYRPTLTNEQAVDTYESSEQAKTARHANLVIANAYGRKK